MKILAGLMPALRVVCSVCLRSISVTSAGLVRAHGPLSHRCPGSNEPPARTQRADDVQLSPPQTPVSSPAGSESSTHFIVLGQGRS